MSPRYLRAPLGRRDEVVAAVVSSAAAIGVGLVAYYLVRLALSREPLPARGVARTEAQEPEE